MNLQLQLDSFVHVLTQRGYQGAAAELRIRQLGSYSPFRLELEYRPHADAQREYAYFKPVEGEEPFSSMFALAAEHINGLPPALDVFRAQIVRQLEEIETRAAEAGLEIDVRGLIDATVAQLSTNILGRRPE
jgi:hypothetical protein